MNFLIQHHNYATVHFKKDTTTIISPHGVKVNFDNKNNSTKAMIDNNLIVSFSKDGCRMKSPEISFPTCYHKIHELISIFNK